MPFAGGWRRYQGSSPNPDPTVAFGAAASALGAAVSAPTLSQPSASAPWGVTRPLGGSVCAFQAHLDAAHNCFVRQHVYVSHTKCTAVRWKQGRLMEDQASGRERLRAPGRFHV